MSLSSDLVSAFAKITNDKPAKNTEGSTAYGRYVLQNDKAYVQIDGSDVLTPVTTTTEARNGDRVTIMVKNHRAVVTGNLSDPSVIGQSLYEFKIEVGNNLSGENLISRINMTPGNILIEAAHINLKGAVTADTIATGALEVGKNVTMGENATISWSKVTDKPAIPNSVSDLYNDAGYIDWSEATYISENAIAAASIYASQIISGVINTNKVQVTGNIYRSSNTFDETNFMIGININKRLQIGSPKADDYVGSAVYSNGDFNVVTSKAADATIEDYNFRVRNSDGRVIINSLGKDFVDGNSAGYKFVVAGETGILYTASTDLKDLAGGNMKVTAVFG